MGDIKLFRTKADQVIELRGSSVALEKSLQTLLEQHLETFLGIRFLAAEYSTGKTHAGRIDTLGIDENNCPVIIEYKRSLNENVINQGLFYLDWLMDHKGEYELLVLKKFGAQVGSAIDWSAPRLLCIAGDFTKYDQHAVQQINRNIELYRYQRYGEEFLLLELVNAVTARESSSPAPTAQGTANEAGEVNKRNRPPDKPAEQALSEMDADLKNVYETLKDFLLGLGDDVQMKVLKLYIAFKRITNFCTVEIRPQARHLLIYAKLNPDDVTLEAGFTRDVRNVGHWGTGDLEIKIQTPADVEKAKPLLQKAYDGN